MKRAVVLTNDEIELVKTLIEFHEGQAPEDIQERMNNLYAKLRLKPIHTPAGLNPYTPEQQDNIRRIRANLHEAIENYDFHFAVLGKGGDQKGVIESTHISAFGPVEALGAILARYLADGEYSPVGISMLMNMKG